MVSYQTSYESCELHSLEDKFIEISGYVYDIPSESNGRYTYVIKTDGAKYKDEFYPAVEYVKLNTDIKFDYAQNVGVRGFLTTIGEKMNYSDFDSVSYNKCNRIFYKISDFETATDNTHRKLYSPRHYAKLLKNAVSKTVLTLGEDEGAVLNSILTGSRSYFTPDYEELLRRNGTLRILYPPYLHIFMIIVAVNFVFMLFDRKTKDTAKIIFVVLYAIAFSESFSGIKLAYVAALSAIAVRKYGYMHYPDILSSVLLILLLANPLLVFNPGFIISSVMSWLFFMLRPIIFRKLNFVKSFTVRSLLTVYIISTFGIVPLCAYFYNSITPYGVLLNALYFPLIILIFISFPFMCLEFALFSRAVIGGNIISGAVYIIHKIPYVVDMLPFSNIILKKPSILTVVALYLSAVVIKDIADKHTYFLRTKILTGVICGCLMSSFVTAILSSGASYINFVNVGHGDGCYIKLSDGKNIIVDGGGCEDFSDYDAGAKIFLPYLKAEGVATVDLAILSHYHKDHCLGTIAAIKNLDVKAVMMPNFGEGDEYREEIETLARKKNIEIIYPENGDCLKFPSGDEIEIISGGNNFSENDYSLVFTLKTNGFKALFTGDATSHTEYTMLDTFSDVDLLKVAHHGSDTSTTDEFLSETTPEYAVISTNEDSVYKLPDKSVLNRLQKHGAYTLRTDKLGDIRFKISKNGKVGYTSYYSDTDEWGFEN